MSIMSDEEQFIKSAKNPIIGALEAEGISSEYLAKLLKEELKAKQIKVFQHQGEVIQSEPLDALEIQQKARMDAHKLLDHYPAERHQFTGELIQKRSPEEIDELRAIVKRVTEEIRGKSIT